MTDTSRPLGSDTRNAFAELVDPMDAKHRGQGIARTAPAGAVDHIARAGSRPLQAVPEVTAGRSPVRATVEPFEQRGLTRGRQLGAHAGTVDDVVVPG